MVYGFSTSMLSSSPPAQTAHGVPIARKLSKGTSSLYNSKPGADVSDKRCSDDGYRRSLSGSSRTPFATSSCSGKPPLPTPATAAAPPMKAQTRVLGFDAPSSGPSAPLDSSPARTSTRASLLSQQLLDLAYSKSADLDNLESPRMPGTQIALDDTQDPTELQQLQAKHAVFSSPLVATAYAIAARAHAGQFRKNGAPVLSHAAATAEVLAQLGLPDTIVAAGLLHDVLCDTPMTACQLEEYLPREVVALVEKVARISAISQVYRDNTHTLEAEALLDMLTSMADVSALLIKLADRLDSMRSLGALPRCKQVRMASETLEVFSVLANRLGAWSLKAELEDLSFATLNPEDYAATAAAISAHTAAGGGSAEGGDSDGGLGAHVEAVAEALAAAGVQVVDVSGRVKNVYGVWKKMKGGGRMEEVYDVQALRVVVPHKHDCYAALRAVEGLWGAVPGRFKDYIRHRKANGYQSLHTTVRDAQGRPLEVQIRTPKMHYIAEYGFAAHWRYKEQLSREDLWLDRLVQWKKWVAAKHLGILDHKVRTKGSPGRDVALEEVAACLGALHGSSGGPEGEDGGSREGLRGMPRPSEAVAAALGEVPWSDAGALGSPRAGRPVVAVSVFAAASSSLPSGDASSGSSGGGGSSLARGQARQQQRAAQSAQRFVARFGLQPITPCDLAQRDAAVLVSGGRGVQLLSVPPGSTAAAVMCSPELLQGQGLWGSPVKLNGQLLSEAECWERVLAPGDQLELLDGCWAAVEAVGRAGSPVGALRAAGRPVEGREAGQGGGGASGGGGEGMSAQRQDSAELQELQRQLRSALAATVMVV